MREPKQSQGPSGQAPLLRAHMPELDAIRGLAILGAVFYHGFYWARDLSAYSPWQRIFLNSMSVGQFSYLSRWYFEESFLRLKDRWEKKVESANAGKLEAVSEAPDPLKP